MPYAIEMYFDAVTEARIRGLWDVLADGGLSAMRDSDARPHVSLAVCDAIDLAATRQFLDTFASTVPCFDLAFASLGLFTTTAPVVFVAPKITPELLALQARFFAEFSAVAQRCWPHYAPSHWVPHCTLAMDLTFPQCANVIEICQTAHLPFIGTVSEIGLVEFRPVRQLHAAFLS